MILEIDGKTINTEDIKHVSEVQTNVYGNFINWRFVSTWFDIELKDGTKIPVFQENNWEEFFMSIPCGNKVNDGGATFVKFKKTDFYKNAMESSELRRKKVLENWGGMVVAI